MTDANETKQNPPAPAEAEKPKGSTRRRSTSLDDPGGDSKFRSSKLSPAIIRRTSHRRLRQRRRPQRRRRRRPLVRRRRRTRPRRRRRPRSRRRRWWPRPRRRWRRRRPLVRRRRRRWRSRRPAQARQAQLRPQKESLPLLRRPRRLHRLQKSRNPGPVHPRARKNSTAPHDRNLRPSSTLANSSHQARPEYSVTAVRSRTVAVANLVFRV